MSDNSSTLKKYSRKVRNIFRTFRHRIFPPFVTLGKLITIATSDRSYLRNRGFFKASKAGLPIDLQGNPTPWMNYPIIDLLEERLNKQLSMFEYGCGNSTLFYASRLKHVTSLEGSKYWHDKIKPLLPENVELIFVDDQNQQDYLQIIHKQNRPYNIVLVDAAFRNKCAEQAVRALTPDGVIIYDDSHRLAVDDPIFSIFAEQGFREMTLRGLKPGRLSEYASTIFYRDNNCLKI